MRKSVFEAIVDKAFRDLEAQFGFKKIATTYIDRSVTVQFQNATTEVLLNYELGDTPWLSISELENPENKSTLGWLLVEKGVEKAPTPAQAFEPGNLENDQLEPTLQKMVKQLIEYGADLLNGNFSIMPNLQKRASKYDSECKRYLSIHQSKS